MRDLPGFTDLHLHLLPNVDDGPRSMQESLELARQLVRDNITRCVVTPHFNAWNPSAVETREDVDRAIRSLQSELDNSQLKLRLFPGAEHFLTPELIDQVKTDGVPLLANGPYILVELPFDSKPLYAARLIGDLFDSGVRPVLAHPARYGWVQANPEAIVEMLDLGVYLQCTAGSLGGQYGPRIQRTSSALLQRGWYSLAGTDIHHPGQPRSLSALFQVVRTQVGDEAATILLFDNPERVLSGDDLLPVPGAGAAPPERKRFHLF